MEYIDVAWIHKNVTYPVRLISELDDRRMEVRKLEFFPGGGVGFAALDSSSHGTRLGLEPVPKLDEINKDPQFNGTMIDASLFELLWRQHVG